MGNDVTRHIDVYLPQIPLYAMREPLIAYSRDNM
jgi:hypothetical protein